MKLFKRGTFVIAVTWIMLFVWRPSSDHRHLEFFQAGGPDVIAHRGGAGLQPENTMVAFDRAVALGADVLELDVHASVDGALVVIHDATLTRTTDADGAVSSYSWSELNHVNAGYRFERGSSYPYRDYPVSLSTLGEVFEAHQDQRFIVEIKQVAPSISKLLCDEIRRHQLLEKVIVGSFHTRTLEDFRAYCPQALTSASRGEVATFVLLNMIGLSHWFDSDAVAFQVPVDYSGINIVNVSFIESAQKAGMLVHVWTINRPSEMQWLSDLGVDGIITDYPDRLIELLASEDRDEGERSE